MWVSLDQEVGMTNGLLSADGHWRPLRCSGPDGATDETRHGMGEGVGEFCDAMSVILWGVSRALGRDMGCRLRWSWDVTGRIHTYRDDTNNTTRPNLTASRDK